MDSSETPQLSLALPAPFDIGFGSKASFSTLGDWFLLGILIIWCQTCWEPRKICRMLTGAVTEEQQSKGKKKTSEAEMQMEFDFPGSNEGEIEQLKIYTFKKSQLKELCSKYGLRKSGNMDILCTRLVEFSKDRDQWSKKPGARRTHKGPQKSKEGGKKNRLKSYERRHTEGETGATNSASQTTEYSTKDTRTKEQKRARVEEARRYRLAHPEYQTPSERRQTKNETAVDPLAILQCINNKLDVVVGQHHNPTPTIIRPIPALTPLLANPVTSVAGFVQPRSTVTPSPTVLVLPPSTAPSAPHLPPATHTATVPQPITSQVIVQLAPSVSSISSSFSQPVPESIHPDARWKSIILYGEEISFRRVDVVDPIVPKFTKDLDKLGRMWDDKNSDFNEKECLLWIGKPERGVPMKYWGDVLKRESPDSWDNRWDIWKRKLYPWSLIGEYYNKVGKNAFWQEFSVDGCKLCQTAIYRDLLKRQPGYKGSH